MKDSTSKDLDFLESLIKEAQWFYKHNNLDVVNSIIDEIEIDYNGDMFLIAFYITNSNSEYRIYDIDFVNYVHRFSLNYVFWKLDEIILNK